MRDSVLTFLWTYSKFLVGFGLVSVRKVSSFVLIHFLVAMDDDVMVTAVNALTDAVKLMTDAQSSIKVPPPHVASVGVTPRSKQLGVTPRTPLFEGKNPENQKTKISIK